MLDEGDRKERIAIGFLIHRSGLDYDRRGCLNESGGWEGRARYRRDKRNLARTCARRFEEIRIGDTRQAKKEGRHRKMEPKVSEKDRGKNENEWRIVWSKQRRTPRGRLLCRAPFSSCQILWDSTVAIVFTHECRAFCLIIQRLTAIK